MDPVVGLVAATALAGYILFGYPLALAYFFRKSRPAVRKDPTYQVPVTVILSVYNGASFLKQKLDSIGALQYPPELIQVLVVSDGSVDQTEAIAQDYQRRNGPGRIRIELLVQPHRGKAAALNLAVSHATGEILFFTDVRQPLDAAALHQLVANFADPEVGAATGEMRLLPSAAGEQQDMDLYWRYELWVRRRHTEVNSLFNTTGCIYALRKSLFKELPEDTLSDDAVLPLRAYFQNYRIVFDPTAIAYDYPALPGTEFRRRWRNLAGLWQVHIRFPRLLGPFHRMWAHFLPHKAGRLFLPWVLLAIVGFTAMLPDPAWRYSLLALEGLPVLLALLVEVIPPPVRRIASISRTFLVMNAASVAALAVFFIPAQTLWAPTRVK